MKLLSEREGLARLKKLKENFRKIIRESYEYRAKNCLTCEHQGICCLDDHFVNVHITELEANLILKEVEKLSSEKIETLKKRNLQTVAKYNLSEGNSNQTFACPFLEKGKGCLIHEVKPLACIQHACYERKEHLPPDSLQEEYERKIERLNRQVYGKPAKWLPLPVWIKILTEIGCEKSKITKT
ncbi:MAG: hypothetical protein D6687_09100 [Acidobacteria bacterium]|jgi:Fe-S-cluster containining protein|nr:MAG: hypothetical protein D6687_09100 [Acidobacteriota bacterium]GIU82293.1 MAG: hypothetical protein KatS3mg006_1357 [Pyrinomonadaceae bacterium]